MHLILSCFSNTLVFQVVLSSDFFTKILCAFPVTPMHATYLILTCVFNLTEKCWIRLLFEVDYYIYLLAGVTGIARDDQWRNLIASVFIV